MNKYYSYKNIEFWQSEPWQHKIAPVAKLIKWIQENDKIRESGFVPSFPCDDPVNHPLFRRKTRGIDDPAQVEYWAKKGINFMSTSQGGKRWFCMAPQKALDEKKKLPFLIVFHREDYSDPWWTMKALVNNEKYNNMLAESQDFIIVYMVAPEVDTDRIYFNILQEATILYHCDLDHLYLDVSKVKDAGMNLRDIPGFTFNDKNGDPMDPDDAVESFGSLNIPVINIAGQWTNGDSLQRGLVMTYMMNDGRFDREWLVRSQVGKKMCESLEIEYRFDRIDDPELAEWFKNMGLKLDVRYTKGERWSAFTPMNALEEPDKKIPVIMVTQEMYHGNEHLPIAGVSYFMELCEIAAQGHCMLLFFALEDIEANELWVDILEEATLDYPIDRSRVYIIGHSHDGWFSYEFACRHPDIITAYACMGMALCPFKMNEVPDYSKDSPLMGIDMPAINLLGLCERGTPEIDPDDREKWVLMWQRNFRAMNIPPRSREEILAAFDSDDSVARITGLPGDRTYNLWGDGVQHYIADFKNKDGKYHLSVIHSENMPHTTTPFQLDLAWNFLRRFKRDTETHEIIELF